MKHCFAQGDLEVIKRFIQEAPKEDPFPLLERFVSQALVNCQVHILDYLEEEQGYSWKEADYIDLCSASGKSAQRLEFMQKRRKECSVDILRQALGNDHLNIYLYYSKEGFAADLDLVVEKGHLALIRQIYLSYDEQGREKTRSFVELGATRNQNGKEILAWFHSLTGKLVFAHQEYALLGNKELFLWCLRKGCLLDENTLLYAFCGENNLEIIKYIVENNPHLPVEKHMCVLVENNRVDVLTWLDQKGYRIPRDAFSTVGVDVLSWMEKRNYQLDKDMFSNSYFVEDRPLQTLLWLLQRDLFTLDSALYNDAFFLDSYEYFSYLKDNKIPLLELNLSYLCVVTSLEMFKQALEMAESVHSVENALGSLVRRENTIFLEILLSGDYKDWRKYVYDMAFRVSPDTAYWLKKKGYDKSE